MTRYAIEHLGYSEGAARHRITAARLARRFPVIFDRVSRGELHLAGLNVLGPHLSDDNCRDLLDAAAGRTRTAIEEIVAARKPISDVLPMVVQMSSPTDQTPPVATPRPPAPPILPGTKPLSAESFSITVTVDRRTRDLLAEARDLLGHAVPGGDLGAVVSRALDTLVTQLRKKKYAETDAPRRARAPAPGSRTIPAAVRRAVADRDGRQCAFVSDEGHRCTETRRLELDHRHAHARGGPANEDNIRLLCATHNALHAERTYGRSHVETKKREARRERDARMALTGLGFKPSEARAAVERAASEVCTDSTLEELIRKSLRHTPGPRETTTRPGAPGVVQASHVPAFALRTAAE